MEKHFFYCSDELRKIWNKHGVFLSKSFCQYFAAKMDLIFLNETGIKPNFKVTIGGFKQDNEVPMYQPGPVSRLNIVLWIMPEFQDHISFCWKSKSGKIVHPYDEKFDESELECWIEGIKPALYWKQIVTEKKDHPFQVKNLPYQLKVYDFGTHMGLNISLKKESNASSIIQELAGEIEIYNNKSALHNGKFGFVHNSSASIKKRKIDFRIDVGSAGVTVIKKMLKVLAKFPEVEEVVIDL